jgi:hypothetical protein
MWIRTGFAANEIAEVLVPGEAWCGKDPPVVLGDATSDGVPEFVLACVYPDGTPPNVYVLDGVAALGGVFAPVGMFEAWTDWVTAVGDLDGDRLFELGLGEGFHSPMGGTAEYPWWSVRRGSSWAGPDLALLGAGGEYGSGPPIPAGDLDLDGVTDLAVWQQPGTLDPVVSLVSGQALVDAGTLSVLTNALRRIDGFGRDEVPADLAAVGDLDGDGQVDLATVVVDSVGQYDDDNAVAVTVLRGTSVADPETTFRIDGSDPGRERWGQVEALEDRDGDGLPELAALLTTNSPGVDDEAEVAVIPSHVLVAGADVPIAAFALADDADQPAWLTVCDLDGDGLQDLVSDAGIWDGRDLLAPGAQPVGPGVERATCAGDLDGVPGAELIVGDF